MFFKRIRRREIVALNLTALIDICAILIIFLILGTVFGESSVFHPDGLKMPKSSNTNQSQSAPQVTIHRGQVYLSIDETSANLEEFRNGGTTDNLLLQRQTIREYLAKLPPQIRKSGFLLNIVADARTPYRDVFDVLRFYRDSGFQSILFVATGE